MLKSNESSLIPDTDLQNYQRHVLFSHYFTFLDDMEILGHLGGGEDEKHLLCPFLYLFTSTRLFSSFGLQLYDHPPPPPFL